MMMAMTSFPFILGGLWLANVVSGLMGLVFVRLGNVGKDFSVCGGVGRIGSWCLKARSREEMGVCRRCKG